MPYKYNIPPETGLDYVITEQKKSLKLNLMKLIPFRWLLFMRSFKNKRILDKSLRYDARLFALYSSAILTGNTKDKLQALVTLSYHNLEKGLSLRAPRPLFGRSVIHRLALRLERYVEHIGWDRTATIAFNVLLEYKNFNHKNGRQDLELLNILSKIKSIIKEQPLNNNEGGIKILTKQEIHKHSKIDFTYFCNMRSSIRNFAAGDVEKDDIITAIKNAQKTPSVCNRQSSRVIVVTNKELINKLLELQKGARGFKEQVPCILIVLNDLSSFQAVAERYQCWIDGGMFSMSLIYALHALGYGTCCLNWSKMPSDDEKFYSILPDSRGMRINMFLAVGNIPEEVVVPQSSPQDFDKVVMWQE